MEEVFWVYGLYTHGIKLVIIWMYLEVLIESNYWDIDFWKLLDSYEFSRDFWPGSVCFPKFK